jgi:tetrathionate reductase subunit B
MERREFLKKAALSLAAAACPGALAAAARAEDAAAGGADSTAAGAAAGAAAAGGEVQAYNAKDHLYGMAIEVEKCIGCGRCMVACKAENDVPPEFFRTWVERYSIKTDDTVSVQCIGLTEGEEQASIPEREILRSFFVPKLCNHCANPPCAQVCPVGATFSTEDGVVLVDSQRCIGCRYCIQACPYGARFLNPATKTADKCTFCYHRVRKGLLPACVEVCPTQARIFGDLNSVASPLTRFKRMHKIHTLKPSLNTEPKVLYAELDGVVR